MKPKRPKLPAVSEQVKAWAAALAAEIEGWPDVRVKSFFGFTALYRRAVIFAVLPRSRSLEVPDSVAFKFANPSSRLLARLQQDSRITSAEMQRTRWFAFALRSDSDVHDALEWLERAYKSA